MKMPSARNKLLVRDPTLQFEPLPEILELLYKLIKPMDRRWEPASIQKMIESGVLPDDYKEYQDKTDTEAQAIWTKIVAKVPEIKFTEDIPLNELFITASPVGTTGCSSRRTSTTSTVAMPSRPRTTARSARKQPRPATRPR